MDQKKTCYDFYVDGMHCAACELYIENNISKHPGVQSVKASLKDHKIQVYLNDNPKLDLSHLPGEFTELVKANGYTVQLQNVERKVHWEEFMYAVPFGLGLILLFLILQKLEIINIVNTSDQLLTYPTIFFIGFVASLSSCMAIVGGLVLSMAATYAKESKSGKLISQVCFHITRIVGFFIGGGLLGLLGSSFKLSNGIYVTLEIIIAFVMILLAFNMMDIFPFLAKLQPKLPKFLSRKTFHISEKSLSSKFNYIILPILLGILTFLLPCGFTQSIQLYALSTGDFLTGALTMFVFALGTFPLLGLVSFASITLSQIPKSGIFFKSAAIIILFFVIINILGIMARIGIISPVLNI